MPIIALITDFGTADGYTGEMKGVVLARCPGATVVDVTHEIAPGDVRAAGWVLNRVWDRFPDGTIHLVVVDPEVGTERRPVAVRAGGRWFVGPDNGLLGPVLLRHAPDACIHLHPERFVTEKPSRTFHGRDVFAPAAAALCAGREASELGTSLEPEELEHADLPSPVQTGGYIRGRIVHVDRFGNLITDVPGAWLAPSALVEVAGMSISGVRSTYACVEPGELVALVGSGGTLEISVRGGSARERLGAGISDEVSVRCERD